MKAELYFERALVNVGAWGMCVYSREVDCDKSIRRLNPHENCWDPIWEETRSARPSWRLANLTIAVKSLNTLIWINDPCRVSETLSMVGERKVAKGQEDRRRRADTCRASDHHQAEIAKETQDRHGGSQ